MVLGVGENFRVGSGMSQRLSLGLQIPLMISCLFLYMQIFDLSYVTRQLSLHNFPMEINEALVSWGRIFAVLPCWDNVE